jgi:hypothetical protein
MLRVLQSLALLIAIVAAPGHVHAQAVPQDRVAFGSDVIVRRGEVVQSVAALGGDVVVNGRVLGDVVALGGDVRLGPGAAVGGAVTSLGGRVDAAPGARVARDASALSGDALARHLQRAGFGDSLEDIGRRAVAHALLFLLALLLMGVAPERLGAMQVVIVRDPLKTGAVGMMGYGAAIVIIALLAITILGIPMAVALAVLLSIATYVGLAASATVIGAALPLERLRGRPVRQLAAGVLVLFIASMVSYLGTVVIVAASCLGLGALLRTRFQTSPPIELIGRGPAVGSGPYRTLAA